MSTRRTRNNPSPSGLKSLPYGPQKRAAKNTKNNQQVQVQVPVPESNPTDKKAAAPASKKRSLATSKADNAPPRKVRTVRHRVSKKVQDERHDDAGADADDDEEVEDMRNTIRSDPKPLPSTSPFRDAEKRLELQQQHTEEFSSEEQQQTEEFSSEEHHSESQYLEYHPQDHSSEESHSQQPLSPKHAEHNSQGYNSRDNSSADATPAPQPAETQPQTQKSPSPYVHKRHYLTPKPRPKLAKQTESRGTTPKNAEPLPKTVQEREELFEEMFGSKLPTYKTGLRDTIAQGIAQSGSRRLASQQDEEEDGDSDGSFCFLDEPKVIGSQLSRWRQEAKKLRGHLDLPPRPTSRPETSRKQASKAAKVKPSTTISNSRKIVIPGPYSEEEIVLTRPDVIDAVRSLVKWAERDETRRVPNAEQMEALLESFDAQESAEVTTRFTTLPSTSLTPSSVARQRRITQSKPSAALRESDSVSANYEGGAGGSSRRRANNDDQSNIPIEMQEPQTPAPQPQESRGFWSGVSAVKNIFTSPLYFFDRRRNQPDSQTATTNGNPATGVSASTQLQNGSGSAGFTNGPSTPTPSHTRRPGSSQSERRRPVSSTRNRRPQTERHRQRRDQAKPPIHLRGLVSPSRIAEIHREQDRLAAERNKKREAYAEEAETEGDSNLARPAMSPSRAGQKRKRAKGTVRTPPACPPGTFRVPSPTGSSDDSSDAETEAEPETVTCPRYAPIPVGPRRELVADDWTNPSPFGATTPQTVANMWRGPMDFDIVYNNFPDLAKPPTSHVSTKLTDLNDSTGSFTVPTVESESESEEEVSGKDKNKEARQNREAVQGVSQDSESIVLQSKQWTQTPPPKPRPGNAQLPQGPPRLSAAAEAAKAKAEKFKPKQPSSLRNVTQMSPLQFEKENLMVRDAILAHGNFDQLLKDSGVPKAQWDMGDAMQDTFHNYMDRDVLSYVNSLPLDKIEPYPLPPNLAEALRKAEAQPQSEVEREVAKHFR